MKTDHELLSAFAPTGVLRASINLGNPFSPMPTPPLANPAACRWIWLPNLRAGWA